MRAVPRAGLAGQVEPALRALEGWIERNGWAGYDPYDIKSTRLFAPLQKHWLAFRLSNELLNRFPTAFRKLLSIGRQINSKAMALFAHGFLDRYQATRNEAFLERARACLEWLLEHPSPGYAGCCWGYPFDWQSLIFIPKGTPSAVVTSIACHAFLEAYEATGEGRYLEAADGCCRFIAADLRRDEVDERRLCFSYTPLDRFHVHNANLWCAASLLNTWKHRPIEAYRSLAQRAINYTVGNQNPDGSWCYWAPPEKTSCYVDNYHTGFVLECLAACRDILGEEFLCQEELEKGIAYYEANHFLADGTARMTKKSTFPVDIHSCAQGIITFTALSGRNLRYLETAQRVAGWTIRHMQDADGHFYYRVNRRYTSRIAYIRWGQAWMHRALAALARRTAEGSVA